MLKIRRPLGRLIFNMGIAIPGKTVFLIETAPWSAPSHYLNQCWNIVNWTLGNKLQWHFILNSYIFIQQNAFGNDVCKMPANLSGPQYVHKGTEDCSYFAHTKTIPCPALIISMNLLTVILDEHKNILSYKFHGSQKTRSFTHWSRDTTPRALKCDFFDDILFRVLNKLTCCRGFETPWHWCDVILMPVSGCIWWKISRFLSSHRWELWHDSHRGNIIDRELLKQFSNLCHWIWLR